MSIVVTGASGHLGRSTAEILLDRVPASEVVLATRRPEALSDLAGRGAEVRQADFGRPDLLVEAFAGAERLLLISTEAVGRVRIRPIGEGDVDSVVELSLRAWAPVFASLERVLGSEIFGRLQPDWREDQRRAVREVCAAKKGRAWVAEADGIAAGFVAVGLFDAERSMGEVSMLAVDPDHQGGGIGTALTLFALDRLKDAGMAVAMVETGGDPGHAAARRTYEKAGCHLLPIARYLKAL